MPIKHEGMVPVAVFKVLQLEGLTIEESLQAIADAHADLHTCIHQMTAKNDLAHLASSERHGHLVDEVMKQQGEIRQLTLSVDNLGHDIGGLHADRAVTDGYIERIAKKLGAETDNKKGPEPIGLWTWKKASAAGFFVVLATMVSHAAVYGLIKSVFHAADIYLTALAAK